MTSSQTSPLTLAVANCQPSAGCTVADGSLKTREWPWFSPIQSVPVPEWYAKTSALSRPVNRPASMCQPAAGATLAHWLITNDESVFSPTQIDPSTEL